MPTTPLSTTADARFWDAIAERYAEKPVARPEAFERKIAVTKARVQPSHVVLDVGCGTGSLALRLAPHAAHVHGLDVSREMVRIARGKAEAQCVENVTFHVGTLESIDERGALGPERLGGVCAYSLLHLVDDREAVLARIFRMLKPGGFFVSSTVCLRDSWAPYVVPLTLMRWMGRAPRVQHFSRRTLEAEMRGAGFVDLELPEVGAQPLVAFMLARKPA